MEKLAPLAVNIIAWNNGVGLTRDIELITSALRGRGHVVALSTLGRGKLRKWARPVIMRARGWLRSLTGKPKYDANIMLEHIRPEDFGFARSQFFIPNPEWCLPSDVALCPRIDGALCKTHHAVTVFDGVDCNTAFCGFTSDDCRDASVPHERAFFHLAGRSSNKGTAQLIALWQRHPEWPMLTVVQNPRAAATIDPPAANIRHLVNYLDSAELRRLQNAHRFHLCPSETEGFGHYIVEAMSLGAIVITTDGAPMNELVTAERGVLVGASRTGTQHLATTYYVDDAAMEVAIQRVLDMPEVELQTLGDNARHWFEANNDAFPERLEIAIRNLMLPGHHSH